MKKTKKKEATAPPPPSSSIAPDKVLVESFTTTSLAPKVNDPEIAALLPKFGEQPTRSATVIRGINSAIANGICRILMNESNGLALFIDQDSWATTDEFAFIDMVTDRVRHIPLVQTSVAKGARFTLTAQNDTDDPIDIMSSQLKPKDKRAPLPFYETICIMTLQPHKSLHFEAIVDQGQGQSDTVFALAYKAWSIPIDERPLDIVPIGGGPNSIPLPHAEQARAIASSSLSNPHMYYILFESVGRGSSERVLAEAVDILIARTERIRSAPCMPGQIRECGGSAQPLGSADMLNLYTIKMPGETHTIGQLFAKCCIEVFPHIDFCACDVDDLNDELAIRVRTSHDPIETVIARTVDYALEKLRAIRSFLV